jgi:hypothetical protein
MTRPTCPYCKQKAMRTNGATIYPHRPDLATLVFYWCPPCEAYVGTHKATGEPLGTLANATLRRLRNLAHAAFDPLHQRQGYDRTVAYSMLASAMGISKDACHIAMFDNAQCRRVVDLINSREIYRHDPKHTNPKARSPDQAAD